MESEAPGRGVKSNIAPISTTARESHGLFSAERRFLNRIANRWGSPACARRLVRETIAIAARIPDLPKARSELRALLFTIMARQYELSRPRIEARQPSCLGGEKPRQIFRGLLSRPHTPSGMPPCARPLAAKRIALDLVSAEARPFRDITFSIEVSLDGVRRRIESARVSLLDAIALVDPCSVSSDNAEKIPRRARLHLVK